MASTQPAKIAATFSLPGINLDYEIGDLVTRVKGREISLDRFAETVQEARYLQIMKIIYNFQEQRTTLAVESV